MFKSESIFHPIPTGKIAIFVFGNCGSGKTTFVQKRVLPKFNNMVWINADQISMTLTKDETKHNPQSLAFAWKKLLRCIDIGTNFVHDTSGRRTEKIEYVTNLCLQNGYKIYFCFVISSLKEIIDNNNNRKRHVPEQQIKSYNKKEDDIIYKLKELDYYEFWYIDNRQQKMRPIKNQYGASN